MAEDDAPALVHMAGIANMVAGKFHRQLCAWCGYRLIDDDTSQYSRVLDEKGQVHAPVAFPLGVWVKITPGIPIIKTVVTAPPGNYHPESCMAAECDPPKEEEKPGLVLLP